MLREKIQSETVTSMKAKDKERTAALRLIGAKIKDRDIELRTADSKPDDEAMVTDVLMKMAKQRRESIEMYEDGGRTELAEKEKAELAVIEEFLPQQMSEDETRAAIAQIKADLGADDNKLTIRAVSDAHLVNGLIAVMLSLFDGTTPEAARAIDAKSVIEKLGLDQHLSPTRRNGLWAMIQRIEALTANA